MPIHRSSLLAALALCALAAAPPTAAAGPAHHTKAGPLPKLGTLALAAVPLPILAKPKNWTPGSDGVLAQKTYDQTLSGGDGTSITQPSTLTIKYATGQ